MNEQSRPHHALGRAPGNKNKILPPTLLQPAEVEALIEACDSTRYALRNRALITLLYRTGAVIGETLRMRLADLDLGRRTISLTGGQKAAARTLGIDEPLHAALTQWLEERARLGVPGDWLFCNIDGWGGVKEPGEGPVSYTAVQHMLRAVTREAGLGSKRVHAQAFRHSFAAELIGEGWPLPYIQRQLGITTFRNIDTLLNNLNLPLPAEDEVIAVIRTRIWDRS